MGLLVTRKGRQFCLLTISVSSLGVTRSLGAPLTELLEVVNREFVPEQVQHRILQCTSRGPITDEGVSSEGQSGTTLPMA